MAAATTVVAEAQATKLGLEVALALDALSGPATPSPATARARSWMAPETRVGAEFAHAIVDNHSRLAYVELYDDERAATVTAFVERALHWFEGHGITTRRLMTTTRFPM